MAITKKVERTEAQKKSRVREKVSNYLVVHGCKCGICGKTIQVKNKEDGEIDLDKFEKNIASNYYKSFSNLYKSNYQNRINYCKNCVVNMFNDYMKVANDIEMGVKLTAQKLDYYWDDSAYSGALKESQNKGTPVIQLYIKNVNTLQQCSGKTFTDYLLERANDDLKASILNKQDELINGKKAKKKELTLLKKYQDFWGEGYEFHEYKFLDDYYNDMITHYDHNLPTQINNYKNMAITQLQADRCLRGNDMSGYDKAMKILSMLSSDSNIKPSQDNGLSKSSKGGYDLFIKHIEDDEPIMDWEKDLGNIDKLKSLLNVFFFGHLSKVLNINNPWQSDYDKEMQSYTVEAPNEEDEPEVVDFLGGDVNE